LHRLLWMDERASTLEAKVARSQEQVRALQDQINALQNRLNALQNRADSTQKRADALQNRTTRLFDRAREEADLLKSSLEVPEELIEEFHEWKTRNKVPEQPLLTIIVATYNRARLLRERCIPSVLNQTYDNLELVVVGDGCTDETEETIAHFKDPRLRFVNLPKRNAYPADPTHRWMVAGTLAMNKGLSMATGDYITHLDDDDEYLPDRLEKLARFAVENKCDFVWHPFWLEDDEGRWKLNEAPDFRIGQVTTSSVFYRSWFRKIPWDVKAYRLMEPGDWNRFRRIKYVGPVSMRYPEPLLKHYRQRSQS
jgi:chaperonin cofactor prefoldin